MAKPERVQMVCTHCGSASVLADAYAEWNSRHQRWEVTNTMDKGGYCEDCEGEARIESVNLRNWQKRQYDKRRAAKRRAGT
jgi:hypothetical protein